jgi:hypothetical protein
LTGSGATTPLDPLLLAQGPDALDLVDEAFADLRNAQTGGSSDLLTSFLNYRQSVSLAGAGSVHQLDNGPGGTHAPSKVTDVPLRPMPGGGGPVPGPRLSLATGSGSGSSASSASSAAALFAGLVLTLCLAASFRVSTASWPLSTYVPPIESPG